SRTHKQKKILCLKTNLAVFYAGGIEFNNNRLRVPIHLYRLQNGVVQYIDLLHHAPWLLAATTSVALPHPDEAWSGSNHVTRRRPRPCSRGRGRSSSKLDSFVSASAPSRTLVSGTDSGF